MLRNILSSALIIGIIHTSALASKKSPADLKIDYVASLNVVCGDRGQIRSIGFFPQYAMINMNLKRGASNQVVSKDVNILNIN